MAFRFTKSSLNLFIFRRPQIVTRVGISCFNDFMTYVDSHSHLADARLDERRALIIEKARGLGIDTFVQGGVDPADWQRQLALQNQFKGIICCFGLHPYFVAAHSEEECEEAMDKLSKMLPKAQAIGEVGLDFRPHISQGSETRQIDFMEKQLELAKLSQKPVVLHIVKGHEEACRILDLWGGPWLKGMVHSFNGTAAKAEEFLKLGLMLSVGGPVCRSSNRALYKAVRGIPLEALLIETDSPDQPPPGIDQNEPATLLQVAEKIAEIKEISVHEVLDRTSTNARKLFVI
jgi:TatD DNase family protein